MSLGEAPANRTQPPKPKLWPTKEEKAEIEQIIANSNGEPTMRAMTSALILGMFLTLNQSQAAIAADDDAKLLDGKWKPVSVSHMGREEKLPPDAYIIIEKGTLAFVGPGPAPKAPVKFDATKSPKQIDLELGEGLLSEDTKADPVNQPGIYKLEGDRLTVCMASIKVTPVNKSADGDEPADAEDEQEFEVKIEAGDRPTAFDDKQGRLMVLERVKE